MKTITTLFALITFHYMAVGQTAPTSVSTENTAGNSCSISYSQDSKNLQHFNGPVKCREITILTLPPMTQSLTVVNIEFGMTGAFSFKKDPSLEITDNRDVYIEDMLTGKVFDLKTSESYTFNVNRRVPERFVLHVDKMIFKYAVSASGK